MKNKLIKGIAALSVALVCACSSVFAASYNLEELNMSVDIPDNLLVAEMNMDENSPIVDKMQTSKSLIINTMKKQNVYLMAVTEDLADSVTISMSETAQSKKIYDFNRFPKRSLQKTIAQSVASMTDIQSYTMENNGQVWLVRCERKTEDEASTQYGVSYFTIVNGQLITINWGSENEPLTDNEIEQIDNIAKSIHFSKVLSGGLVNYNDLIKGITVVVCIILAAVVLMVIITRRRNAKQKPSNTAVQRPPHRPKSVKTPQSPVLSDAEYKPQVVVHLLDKTFGYSLVYWESGREFSKYVDEQNSLYLYSYTKDGKEVRKALPYSAWMAKKREYDEKNFAL